MGTGNEVVFVVVEVCVCVWGGYFIIVNQMVEPRAVRPFSGCAGGEWSWQVESKWRRCGPGPVFPPGNWWSTGGRGEVDGGLYSGWASKKRTWMVGMSVDPRENSGVNGGKARVVSKQMWQALTPKRTQGPTREGGQRS